VAERRPLFSIGAVARMLDLAPATIRTWEARYELIVPARSEGGQRLYTREQVDQLRFIQDCITGGRRPAEAHRLLADRLANGAGPGGVSPVLQVLLAERRPGALEGLRRLFGSDVFEVVHAPDGETAAALYAELRPALVVVDTDDETFDELARSLRAEGTKLLPLELLERPLALLTETRALHEV
jgi:DNA-binding transcriptional MerR regulator